MTLRNKILPENRRPQLKRLLDQGRLVRVLEAHNGLSGIIADTVTVEGRSGDATVTLEFDALWESSLTDSAAKGHPDIEVISFDSRLHTIHEILMVTRKPMIVDGDTGGDPTHFEYMVSKLERVGVSAVIIEDKVFPKRNSLETGASQTLEDPGLFAEKIRRGKEVQMTPEFMIIARLESLIAGAGISHALSRAETYLKAGVDGILIHSKAKDPAEVLEFAGQFQALQQRLGLLKPLACVPTTYHRVLEDELKRAGFQLVIYANHLLRSAYQTMRHTARTILLHQRSLEADPLCAPVRDLFRAVGFLEVTAKDKQSGANTNLPIIIPAAGEPVSLRDVAPGRHQAMLDIAGKTLLARQVKAFNVNGLNDITVITGFAADQMQAEGVAFTNNPDFSTSTELHSLLRAREKMTPGFVMLYGDVLVEFSVIAKLLGCQEDIVLVVDNSIRFHGPVEGKRHDCVVSRNRRHNLRRHINFDFQNTLAKIGQAIDPAQATHEFIGLAKFSRTGAEQSLQTYEDCVRHPAAGSGETDGLSSFRFTDLIQEMIDRGFNIHYLEIHKGWLEVHRPEDITLANEIFVHPKPPPVTSS